MQIECVLKRDGGTQINLGAALYHFQPQADGAHVASVDDDAHIERLLAIPEGYRIYRGSKAKQDVAQQPAPTATAESSADDAVKPSAKPTAKKK
ncbi:MAG TPA: hypothetical protein VL051_09565 [Burkholderiaceae bacterium]|nr:hypothetical protein [Burkholderiaceae bacterium]